MAAPEEALSHFFQLTVLMADAMEEDLALRKLTRARATLLAHLQIAGPSIQNSLAQALRVTPRNITGLINGLESQGLVKRAPHPTDGRATLVELTRDGKRAAAALARDERQLARFLFADHRTSDLTKLVADFGALTARLATPEFDRMRRAAVRRWPLR